MPKFCLSTLNCNDRAVLYKTVNSLLKTIVSGDSDSTAATEGFICPWHIYMQGCTDEFITKFVVYTKELEASYPWIKFHIHTNAVNEGLSKGLNKLNELTQLYEYVLFIEDDWYCLPQKLTGLQHNNWLDACIKFMDANPSISTIGLRRYHDDAEKYQYGWTRTIPYYCHQFKNNFNYAQKIKEFSKEIKYDNLRFIYVPEFLYTNNPCIRRNNDYYKLAVFPFQEFPDINNNKGNWTAGESKDVQYWGAIEATAMEKTRHLVTFYLDEGIFGHYEDWQPDLDD